MISVDRQVDVRAEVIQKVLSTRVSFTAVTSWIMAPMQWVADAPWVTFHARDPTW